MSRKKAAQAAPETRDEEAVGEAQGEAQAAAAGAAVAGETSAGQAGAPPAVADAGDGDGGGNAGGAEPAPVLKVRTRNRQPFRRAGITFFAEWTELPLDALTADQVARIEAEKMLEVVRA